MLPEKCTLCVVSTHSRAEAAAKLLVAIKTFMFSFQHTAARRRLPPSGIKFTPCTKFQHTAARRRLRQQQIALLKLI